MDVVAADWSVDGNEILCGKGDGGVALTDPSLSMKRQFATVLGDASLSIATVTG